MTSTELTLADRTFSVPQSTLLLCDLFHRDTSLLNDSYAVRSPVPPSLFEHFLSALNGDAIPITKDNRWELGELCAEFCYGPLSSRLLCFDRSSESISELWNQIRTLQDQQLAQKREIESLRSTIESLPPQPRPPPPQRPPPRPRVITFSEPSPASSTADDGLLDQSHSSKKSWFHRKRAKKFPGKLPRSSPIIFVGPVRAGKTRLLNAIAYWGEPGPTEYCPTLSCPLIRQEVIIGGKSRSISMWDTGGAPRFRTLVLILARDARAILFVYDQSDPQTFAKLEQEWIPALSGEALAAVRVIVGTIDPERGKRVVPEEDAMALGARTHALVATVSFDSKPDVDRLFEMIVLEIMKRASAAG
jgi:GTPase SAR1 family protein